jgi:serine/threonine protein kinase/tetratricopeptide (TPR) repeat protein
MSEQLHREEAVFEAALLLPEPERGGFLDKSCGENLQLRQRLEALLSSHDNTSGILEQPGLALLQNGGALETTRLASAALPSEKPGDKIGRYKLLQQIGEGGGGVVYMAEQEEPVRRRVALKIIKLGMDTKQVIARFEAERQALALMDHPNIAKVFDAGATEAVLGAPASLPARPAGSDLAGKDAGAPRDAGPALPAGRPYFVMELVRGTKITDFCNQKRLSTRERLDLFIQVCGAIQHAHQKGIIHRDIKPSNILVTSNDGIPLPKVIDFGIAKATQGRLTDKTVFTAFEQFIGTPAYMSPEQAELNSMDVDTRSDIYSLGVLLYELLTGKTPFDTEELLRGGLQAMRRTICEKEPERPSTRLSTMLAAELDSAALQRQTEPPKLINSIRGDLDWIVIRCLEKDRTRRYETANGLANDLQRHLKQEPVSACPPSNLYRFQKLVRRNKAVFAAGGAVTVALLLGLSLSTWEFVKERKERRRAVAAEREQARLRNQAQSQAIKSQHVAQFLKDMLGGVGPSVAKGRDTTMLREILDKTAERVGKDLKGDPDVGAELRSTIGKTYFDLGDYSKAEAMHREALRLRQALFGETNQFVAASLNDLGDALREQDRLAEAEPMIREALAMRRLFFGAESAEVAESLTSLADLLGERGLGAEAETVQREALRIQTKTFHGPRPEVVVSLMNLGAMLGSQAKLDEAEAVNREALAMSREVWGNENGEAATLLRRLGYILEDRGKLAEAESICREGLAMQRKLLGDEHPEIAFFLGTLVRILRAQGRLAEAEPFAREWLGIGEKKMTNHWQTFNARHALGAILLAQNKYAEAEPLLLSAYEGMKQHADKTASQVRNLAAAAGSLVQLYEATGRSDQAAVWRNELAEWQRKEAYRQAAEAGDPSALNALAWLLATCPSPEVRDGRSAVTFAEKAVAGTQRKDAAMLDTLAAAYAEAGDFAKAVSVQQEAIALIGVGKGNNGFMSRLKLYQSNTPYREP